MANRYFRSQFLYSFFNRPVKLAGSFDITPEAKASRTTQGILLTAVDFGSAGNSITIAFTGGGTAGAEVVTVTGTAISVQIESGVSTVTDVANALTASLAASALATTTSTGLTTVSTASALALTGGIDGVVAGYSIQGVASIEQTAVGEFTITLEDTYYGFISGQCNLMVSPPITTLFTPMFTSADVETAKTIVITLFDNTTVSDPDANATMYFELLLQNGSRQ